MEREQLTLLVSAAQQGDNSAFSALFNVFQNTVYNIALRETKDPETAADVVQETFIEVIQTIGKLQEPAAFVTWLKTITYHQCTRYYRKKENRHETLVEEREDAPALFDTIEEVNEEFIPDKAMENEEFCRTIRAFVDKLPDVQRAAIMMKYFDDLSVKEIAAVQGVSENTVLSRLYYGRNAIKAEVEAYEKKHDTKLHAIPFLPLVRFLWGDAPQQMAPATTASIAQSVGATTGVQLTVASAVGTAASTAAGTAAGTAVAAGAGVAVKAAAIPLAAKIAAGVVAAVVAVTAPIAIHRAVNDDDSSDGGRHAVSDGADEGNGNNHTQNGDSDTLYDPNSGTYKKPGSGAVAYLSDSVTQANAMDMLFAYAYSVCPAQYYDADSGRYVVPDDVMLEMAATFFRQELDMSFTELSLSEMKMLDPYFFGECRTDGFVLGHNPADFTLTSHLVIPEEKVVLLFFSYEGDAQSWSKSYCMVGYEYAGTIDEAQLSVETDANGWYFRSTDPALLDSLRLGCIEWTPYSMEGMFNGSGMGSGDLFGDADDLLGDLLEGLL